MAGGAAASIVPPPFGSGYVVAKGVVVPLNRASIVPPPFGSGYKSLLRNPYAPAAASIVPPPFGSGYPIDRQSMRRPAAGFNRAAPFRERLSAPAARLWNGGVMLQSCRPLSGAVILPASRGAVGVRTASIVPPPFGSGYGGPQATSAAGIAASIVPPPFGSGYRTTPSRLPPRMRPASIVPPPFGSGYNAPASRSTGRSASFNRAAPFRERL